MAITIITVISMTLWGGRSSSTPESTLGAAMLIIAVYFFLSIIIMPQFGDIDQIYGLAAYQGEKQTVNTRDALTFYFIMVTLFITGFLAMRRKIRRGNSWT
jgi:predicted transporter